MWRTCGKRVRLPTLSKAFWLKTLLEKHLKEEGVDVNMDEPEDKKNEKPEKKEGIYPWCCSLCFLLCCQSLWTWYPIGFYFICICLCIELIGEKCFLVARMLFHFIFINVDINFYLLLANLYFSFDMTIS